MPGKPNLGPGYCVREVNSRAGLLSWGSQLSGRATVAGKPSLGPGYCAGEVNSRAELLWGGSQFSGRATIQLFSRPLAWALSHIIIIIISIITTAWAVIPLFLELGLGTVLALLPPYH